MAALIVFTCNLSLALLLILVYIFGFHMLGALEWKLQYIDWEFRSNKSCMENWSFYNFWRLEKLGALEWTKVVHKHQEWRLFTCIWLHAGVIHLLVNMLSLIFVGIRLEQQFGFGMISLLLSCVLTSYFLFFHMFFQI